jgi:hypothetical protein
MNTDAHAFDDKATNLAKEHLRTEGALLSVLIEMRRRKLFAALNYSGIFDYCERRLSLSRAQAYYFEAVAEKSEDVPQIKQAVEQGELTLSQARRILPVITKENHTEWVQKAKSLPQKELEREVTAVNPKAHVNEKIRPVAKELSELKVAVDPKTEENLAALKEILSQKHGKPATLAEVVAWAAEVTRTRFDPVKKAERTRAVSSRKSAPAPRPGRRPIPAAVQHSIMRRDDMRCTYFSPDGRRCEQKRWLERHHQIEVARGGLNTVENLRLLCRAHHDLVHSKPVGRGP